MAVIYPVEGRLLELFRLIQSAFVVGLFKNNLTPDEDTVWADLTQCDFSGYAEVNVTWSPETENVDSNAQTTSNACRFLHDGGPTMNNVYGWYIRSGSPETIVHCERFGDAPRVMNFVPDEIQVTVRKTQGGCP